MQGNSLISGTKLGQDALSDYHSHLKKKKKWLEAHLQTLGDTTRLALEASTQAVRKSREGNPGYSSKMSRNLPDGVSKGGSIDQKYYYSSSHVTPGSVHYVAPSDDYYSTYSSLAQHKNQAPVSLIKETDPQQYQADMMQTMKLPGIGAEKRYQGIPYEVTSRNHLHGTSHTISDYNQFNGS
jgi:hypothetical protein